MNFRGANRQQKQRTFFGCAGGWFEITTLYTSDVRDGEPKFGVHGFCTERARIAMVATAQHVKD